MARLWPKRGRAKRASARPKAGKRCGHEKGRPEPSFAYFEMSLAARESPAFSAPISTLAAGSHHRA
jgi:hypothetical protein